MFNIDIPYKSATPMKLIVAQKPGSKNLLHNSPFRGLGGLKNYCILRPVLWMQ